MKKACIITARYGVLLGVLLFGAWYISTNYDRFASAANFTTTNIALLIVLNILTMICEAVRLKIQIRKIGYDLPYREAWNIFTVMQATNHLVLKAGTFSAGYYMTKKYKISFHAYCALVITYLVIMTLGSGIFGLMASVIFLLLGNSVDPTLPIFFLAVIASCVFFIGLASVKIPLTRLPHLIQRVVKAWREIYTDYRLILSFIGVELCYFFMCSVRFYVAVRIFNLDMGYIGAVAVVTVGNFLRVASVVPGGLGVAEIASGWTAAFIGGEAGASGLSAGLDRLVYVVLILLFGGIGFFMLSGRKEFHKPTDETAVDEYAV